MIRGSSLLRQSISSSFLIPGYHMVSSLVLTKLQNGNLALSLLVQFQIKVS